MAVPCRAKRHTYAHLVLDSIFSAARRRQRQQRRNRGEPPAANLHGHHPFRWNKSFVARETVFLFESSPRCRRTMLTRCCLPLRIIIRLCNEPARRYVNKRSRFVQISFFPSICFGYTWTIYRENKKPVR